MDGLAHQCDNRCRELSTAPGPSWTKLEALCLSTLIKGNGDMDEGWTSTTESPQPGTANWQDVWKDRLESSYWCTTGPGDVASVDGGTWRQDHPKVTIPQPHHDKFDCSNILLESYLDHGESCIHRFDFSMMERTVCWVQVGAIRVHNDDRIEARLRASISTNRHDPCFALTTRIVHRPFLSWMWQNVKIATSRLCCMCFYCPRISSL
jgi:hypothetical protein